MLTDRNSAAATTIQLLQRSRRESTVVSEAIKREHVVKSLELRGNIHWLQAKVGVDSVKWFFSFGVGGVSPIRWSGRAFPTRDLTPVCSTTILRHVVREAVMDLTARFSRQRIFR